MSYSLRDQRKCKKNKSRNVKESEKKFLDLSLYPELDQKCIGSVLG